MTITLHDIGIARQIGQYSDAAEVSGNVRWLRGRRPCCWVIPQLVKPEYLLEVEASAAKV